MSSGSPLPIQEEEIHRLAIAPAAGNNDANPEATAALPIIDKRLFSVANLVKLLPTTTGLAFQILSRSPALTNHGNCHIANKCLTRLLLFLCSASYVASTSNYEGEEGEEERRRVLEDLRRFRLRWLDGVHAVFGLVVFLSMAFGDAGVRTCFFRGAGVNVRLLLLNLPLGAGLAAAIVFMIFPSSRKGIGYTN